MTSAAERATVHIGELSIVMRGLDAGAAHHFAEEVSRLVARRLAAGDVGQSVALGALELRVRVPRSEMTPVRVANAITDAVTERST